MYSYVSMRDLPHINQTSRSSKVNSASTKYKTIKLSLSLCFMPSLSLTHSRKHLHTQTSQPMTSSLSFWGYIIPFEYLMNDEIITRHTVLHTPEMPTCFTQAQRTAFPEDPAAETHKDTRCLKRIRSTLKIDEYAQTNTLTDRNAHSQTPTHTDMHSQSFPRRAIK